MLQCRLVFFRQKLFNQMEENVNNSSLQEDVVNVYLY